MRTFYTRFLFLRYLIIAAVRPSGVILQFACLVLCSAPAHAQEVKMYTGCNMVLSGDVSVVFNNTQFKNNGTFVASTSTVSFVGNNDTSLANISGTSNTTFNNLTLNKSAFGIAVKSWVGVKNILTVSAGKLYANGNLTLLSDVSNTARLAVVPSTGAYIYGNTLVERYIPSKRSWRLMTAPVTSGLSIYNSWQNGGVYTVGRGLLISGPGASNGLDNGNAYSLKKWNAATQALVPVTNTNLSSSGSTGSADNIGYFVFIRGDRNPVNFSIPNTNITTITSIGLLQTGTQTFTTSSTANAYTLIGNPYASPIDFNLLTRSNLLKRFYVWDPTLNSLGGYVTMDDLNNDGVYSKSVSASAQTQEIQSSQAFFVQTTANGAASITINESAKSTVNNTAVFRPVNTGTISGKISSLRANVYILNTDSSLMLADGALAEFGNNFTDDVTNEDAIKFANINETIGFSRNATNLAIERRPVIDINDTLFIKLLRTTRQSYQLQFVSQNLNQPGLTAYLEDNYLATASRIDLSDIATINFAVDGNAASADANRFRIVFKRPAALPVAATELAAYHVNDDVQVDWQPHGDTINVKYEVEKSANGKIFSPVNTTQVSATATYSWVDAMPFAGKNFYRIKSIHGDGTVKYSPVVNVMMETKTANFSIHPNPVNGTIIHIQFKNQPTGKYKFDLINGAGQVVSGSEEQISNSSTSYELNTNTALPAGLYQLKIAGPGNTIETQKVIIQQ